VARVMNVQSSTINDESSPESIENWTSFNGYVLLYELETEFKVKFTIDEVMDVKKIADIKRHLKNHGVILND
ncbi:MAG: acyl carrier protein, partial [Nitrosopumilales archaeon CG11_big_fil_rev_8_21_14_0_20_33_24]